MEQEDTVVLSLSDFPKPNMSQKDKPNYYNPVNEYTLEGVYVKTWKSPAVAARNYDIPPVSLNACCKGVPLFLEKYGKIFLYKGDSIDERLEAIKQQEKNRVKTPHLRIEVYSKEGNLLSCYPSLSRVSFKYSISAKYIKDCCIGKRVFVKDYIFLFEGRSIKERLKLIKQKEKLDEAIEKEILKEG